jgi:hypothetical protein
MTTKDLLYLTAIAIAALLAYCHGFFSGFNRARKIYDSLLGEPAPAGPASGEAETPAKGVATAPAWEFNGSRNRLSGQDLRGDFGNN